MNRRTAYKVKQLFVIMISWVLIGIIIAIFEHLVLQTQISQGFAPGYDLGSAILLNMAIGFLGALLGGSLLVFYVNVKYNDKPYGYTLIIVAISFLCIILLVNEILEMLAMGDVKRLQKNGIVWAVVVSITQLFLQVNSKFGQGIFWDLISGRYNTPKVETRIFMFLDLNSSTTIAERLGDQKYHELLKDLFIDITNPILDHRGEIYQYVGDEVVIAWRNTDDRIGSQCIDCFFDIKKQLLGLQKKYDQKYGFQPSFKAGIHFGQVVAGEVGIIKRDITYSGDVLNTTSRILSMCKEFGQELIVSSELIGMLHPPVDYGTTLLGDIKLKGKEKEVSLVGISRIY